MNDGDNGPVITARHLQYADLDTPLTGVLCRDETKGGGRPGVLLFHGGAGLDEHARHQACRYAALGYTVLACDMFGDGVAGDRDRIIQCLYALRDDPTLLLRRARAGLATLADHVGPDRHLAAVGFCFGGMVALALARAGDRLAGAVSIHGSLSTSRPAERGAVHAKVLVCHGALDPHVPTEHVAAFAEEMSAADADWQLVMYGGALHGFTHSHAQPGAVPGVAYNQMADARAFAATRALLSEAFSDSRQDI